MIIEDSRAFADAFTAAVVADLANPAFLDVGVLDAAGLRRLIAADIARSIEGVPGEPLFPRLREFVKTRITSEEARYAAGLSQWEVLGQLLTTAADVGAKYLTQRIETQSQVKIAELQLKAQALTQAQAAASAAPSFVASPSAPVLAFPQQPVAGGGAVATVADSEFPVIPVAVGAGILVLGGVYFLTRRRR